MIIIACILSCTLSAQGVSVDDYSSQKLVDITKQISLLEDDHCEVPCGIYGDSLRVALLKEHSSTIEKAMTQISKISQSETVDYNQLIRWVNNKEKHAEEIQNIVSQYFLHQRIKNPAKRIKDSTHQAEADKRYRNQLVSLHNILVAAMKCKQSTEYKKVSKLNLAIESFEELYFHKHPH